MPPAAKSQSTSAHCNLRWAKRHATIAANTLVPAPPDAEENTTVLRHPACVSVPID